MRCLVTGAGGMLASDLVPTLKIADFEVVAASHGALDITDLSACRRAVESIDVVINCAAWTNVDAAEEHLDEVMRVNVEGPRNLALATKENGARLLQISTDYVFSGNAIEPYEETDVPSALSVYGRSKLQSEDVVLKGNPSSWIVRTEWLYGAQGKCFPKTIAHLLSTHPGVDVVADQIGQPTWTKDLARVIRDMVVANLQGGIYNVSSSGECSWYEFAQVIAASAGVDINRVHPTATERFPRPAHRPHYSVLANAKLRTAGVVPISDWEERWNEAAPSVLPQ